MKNKLLAPFALVLGAIGGLAVGVLIAPHKGTLTRSKLKNKLEEGKERSQERAHELREKAKDNSFGKRLLSQS